MEKKIPVSFRLSPEVKNRLEVVARESGLTATQEAERLITSGIEADDHYAKVYGERFAQLLNEGRLLGERMARITALLEKEGVDPTLALGASKDQVEQLRRNMKAALEEIASGFVKSRFAEISRAQRGEDNPGKKRQ